MGGATVSAPYARVLLEGAKQAGIEVGDLVSTLGLEAPLDDPEARVDLEQHRALWELVPERCCDDAFGLHLAAGLQPGAFAVMDYAARNAPTLRGALERIARYCRLVHDGSEVSLTVVGDEGRLAYTLPGFPGGSPRHAAEFIVGAWLVCTRQMLDDAEVRPRRVAFQHPEPADTSEHSAFFGCPVAFDAPANELVLDGALLDRPVAKADPALCALLDRYAEELLAKLPKARPFLREVRSRIATILPDGDPGLSGLADSLHMSPRTLQRKLADEGTTYKDLVDELRHDLARKYLLAPAIAVTEAAFLLGFSDPSAFHRAFKRWTGTTPGEYRKIGLAG